MEQQPIFVRNVAEDDFELRVSLEEAHYKSKRGEVTIRYTSDETAEVSYSTAAMAELYNLLRQRHDLGVVNKPWSASEVDPDWEKQNETETEDQVIYVTE